jgi:hypothetical protein
VLLQNWLTPEEARAHCLDGSRGLDGVVPTNCAQRRGLLARTRRSGGERALRWPPFATRSQGGDTGSNPVGAASKTAVQRHSLTSEASPCTGRRSRMVTEFLGALRSPLQREAQSSVAESRGGSGSTPVRTRSAAGAGRSPGPTRARRARRRTNLLSSWWRWGRGATRDGSGHLDAVCRDWSAQAGPASSPIRGRSSRASSPPPRCPLRRGWRA